MSKNILVVDDDKEFLEELKEMLQSSGYEVTALSESVAVMQTVRKSKPDLILLDLRMLSMSGFEVANELKRYPDTATIPILAMTGFYTMKEHSWLMNFCGIKKCLKKPFKPLDVIAEIERALGSN